MSKRKLQQLVDTGIVDGWDDPRFPTIQGIYRRGMMIETLKVFMLLQGASVNTINMEWDKIWAENEKVIDPISKRFNAIKDETKQLITVSNLTEVPEGLTVKYHPKVDLGTRVRLYNNQLYVEKSDLKDLKVGDKFTLREIGNVYID